jgi:HlyD family secretion protein
MKRFLFWLIAIGILVAAGASGYHCLHTSKNGNVSGRFRMGTVQRGDVTRVVNSSGTVKPVRSVEVGSFVSGPVLKVHVDFNSTVKAGQLLAQIDPRLYNAALAHETATLLHSKADLVRVEALLNQAIQLEERGEKLKPQAAIAETELEQYVADRKSYEAQVDLAKAVIAQSEANLSTAKTNLEFTEIKSPVDGVVIDRKVDPGQTVAASFQTPTMFIVAPDLDQKVYVYASVDEADIGMICQAQSRDEPVSFSVDAYPNDAFQGKIAQVRLNPTTVQNVVTYTVIVESPNPGRKLLPGMTANLTFQIEKHQDVLLIPNVALRFRPKADQVRPADRAILDGETDSSPNNSASDKTTDKTDKTAEKTANTTGDKTPDKATENTTVAAVANDGKASLERSRTHKHVWVADGEWLSAVEVVIGVSDKNCTEITSGNLAQGQEVILGSKTNSTK